MKCGPFNLLTAAACLVVAMAVALPVSADSYFKMVTHTDAMEMMGQKIPATDDTSSVWITEGKASTIGSDGVRYVFDETEDVLYAINPATEEYAQMSMDFEAITGATEEEEDEQAREMAEQMMGQIDISVTPTGESKKIRDWNTSKYVVKMDMGMAVVTTEVWATEDIEVDYDAFKSVTNSQMAIMPGYEKVLAEWKKVKGLAVYSVSETNLMGTVSRTTMEVLEYSDKDAPSGTFDIPKGYKEVDMMQMQIGVE